MKIALIGSAPSSITLAPYFDKSFSEFAQGKQPKYPPSEFIDESWEIWGCSPGAFGVVKRATRWFEVHRWEPGAPWFSPEYCQFLREFKGPVYVGGEGTEVQNAVIYPIERVETEFSSYFLTSSLSLMMALAIIEIEDLRKANPNHDPKEDVIGFWGVDMAATEEYGYQRAGCQFFILEALRRGIGVFVPPESDLLRPMPVYGLCEWDHNYIKMTARAREFSHRLNAANQALAEKQQEVQFLRGAVDDLNYTVNTWTSKYGLPAGVVLQAQQAQQAQQMQDPAKPPQQPSDPQEWPHGGIVNPPFIRAVD